MATQWLPLPPVASDGDPDHTTHHNLLRAAVEQLQNLPEGGGITPVALLTDLPAQGARDGDAYSVFQDDSLHVWYASLPGAGTPGWLTLVSGRDRVTKADLKAIVAASVDFVDFQNKIAAL
jgi:hypothetical protein